MKKILKVRWIATLLLVVGAVIFFSFKSGDSRSLQRTWIYSTPL